jgi:HSP20 family protein
MDRLFEDFARELPDLTRLSGLRGGGFPALNVWEDDRNIYVEAEVPGMKMDDLELTVLGNELTIKGCFRETKREGVSYHRRERGGGSFTRVLRLPVDLDAEQVQAGLENGVLTVTMPKAASAKARKIEVKTLNS